MRPAGVVFLSVLTCAVAATQDQWFAPELETTTWPSPESLVRDLRSSDENVRAKALTLAGVQKTLLHDYGSPAVVRLNQIMLRYASLGESETLDAILTLRAGPMSYAAVAIPEGGTWRRIGATRGWCKYCFSDPLADVSVNQEVSPGPEELVMRFDGGGTGLYEQQEIHYRIQAGRLKPILSFESRRRSCPAAPMRDCEISRRWFERGFLVETTGTIPLEEQAKTPDTFWEIPDLEIRYTGKLLCTPYAWNQPRFEYEKAGKSRACPVTKR